VGAAAAASINMTTPGDAAAAAATMPPTHNTSAAAGMHMGWTHTLKELPLLLSYKLSYGTILTTS
jgi:hypothetical protein